MKWETSVFPNHKTLTFIFKIMNTQANIEKVQALYEAFGQGNIPVVLGIVSENFEWIDPGSPDIPYAGHYTSRSGFGDFFQKMNTHAEITSFDIHSIRGVDDQVFATGRFGVRARVNNKTTDTDFVMIWNFSDGIPTSGQAYIDTNSIASIFRD
jgi:ketosteroid isomerase-like protein